MDDYCDGRCKLSNAAPRGMSKPCSVLGDCRLWFQENKGVVAEGFLRDKNYFKAVKILAKHDENYMPPELSNQKEDK